MLPKISFNPTALTALTLFFPTLVPILFGEARWGDVAPSVFALTLNGWLVISYFLRIALVFWGVFATYQMIRKHVNVKPAIQRITNGLPNSF